MAIARTKKPKAVRQPQYEQIAESKGFKLTAKNIFGFRFPSLTESHAFHYDLMRQGIKVDMYDGVSEKVRIICNGDITPVREIAAAHNGTEYTLTPLNDYE